MKIDSQRCDHTDSSFVAVKSFCRWFKELKLRVFFPSYCFFLKAPLCCLRDTEEGRSRAVLPLLLPF